MKKLFCINKFKIKTKQKEIKVKNNLEKYIYKLLVESVDKSLEVSIYPFDCLNKNYKE